MLNLSRIKSIHFTGIKGVGMTALALCAQDLGKKISGSDTDETFPTSAILQARGIKSKIGFAPKNLPSNCDLLIFTGAHGGATNPEVTVAQKLNIPVLSHAEALALFTQNKQTIAVAGVGGKSTTSAMTATVLDAAGLKPSFAVGVGNIPALGTPGRFVRKTPFFVVESDEYVTDPQTNLIPRFHHLDPFIAIITNLEHDHPDVYPTLADVFSAFKIFIDKVKSKGLVIVNIDNPRVRQLVADISRPVVSYGFSPQADWQVVKTHTADQKQFFRLQFKNMIWPDFILNVPGQYNVLNAVAAIACAHQLGVSVEKIQAGLKAFTGTSRRFEFIGEANGILLYDDYAHHPIEIRALLKAARQWFPGKRIFAIFQSHTYSRTKALLAEFARSFAQADQVVINDIFASAREKDNLGLTGLKLTQAIKKHQPHVSYCPGKEETIEFIANHVRPGDVVFTVGAGNNFLWHQDILKALRTISK